MTGNAEVWAIKRRVKEELVRRATNNHGNGLKGMAAIASEVEGILEETGMGVRLKNVIYNLHRTAPKHALFPSPGLSASETYVADKLDFVERAKLKWEKRIRQELDAMAAELDVPLQRLHKDEPPKLPTDDQAIRFVYDDNDLLDVLSNIVNQNNQPMGIKNSIPDWGLIKVELEVKDLDQTREVFKELDPSTGRHLGVDDEQRPQLLEERVKAIKRALEIGYIPMLRHLAKRGIPQALRPAVWKTILNVSIEDQEQVYIEQLQTSLRQWDLVTDELFRLDVTITSNDDDYFVFEETLSETMALFSRDSWLVKNAAVRSQANEKFLDEQQRESAVFPPCGIVPFRGIVMYATPLCYQYINTTELYYVFRSLYAQYCCRLHTVTSDTGDIMQLARQFESLLQETNTLLYHHILSKGVHPLKLAFNWIVFVFAGYLDVDQVLTVWDRILAWDSLLLVPVIAASIISFREKRLMECNTLEEMQDVLSDGSKLKVILLLQLYLFGDTVARLQEAQGEGKGI
ncbi:hypothetical protein GUITHDRAFT_103588 [Guillardia theta CCMP2712]|uniref:Rab-GAP TBC domain-containing protein n=2 Tax=Guillardia theta TaxID=55529 RepID=L1JRR8_GUITC|nr:hypothetical protein GUITHDRAFT_103588 [Guillardia theta CCMP2712]EKX50999.1 hypothetical protein GUITHDRAFT_103588 [Guillardia theta CCMP2712]|eukprot:XP_005837979.1 hypothetical protein GUITHDRAFT_103588 [Guillardia theta CCMP2712]